MHWEPLSATRLQELREIWACVRYLIVDEISMVSAATLWHIHRRLVEITGTSDDRPFGGINLIVLGDFYQVSATPVVQACAATVLVRLARARREARVAWACVAYLPTHRHANSPRHLAPPPASPSPPYSCRQ